MNTCNDMTDKDLQVLLVDDHQVLIDSLQMLLKNAPGITIVGSASNGQQLLEALQTTEAEQGSVDIILMDINMPVMDGLEATRLVKANFPEIKVIILSMQDRLTDIEQAMASGADGFLSKNSSKDEITQAIRNVYTGREFALFTPPSSSAAPTNHQSISTNTTTIFFTELEKRIIHLICQEYQTDDIAAALTLSPLAVSIHRKNIYSKLGVHSDVDLKKEVKKYMR